MPHISFDQDPLGLLELQEKAQNVLKHNQQDALRHKAAGIEKAMSSDINSSQDMQTKINSFNTLFSEATKNLNSIEKGFLISCVQDLFAQKYLRSIKSESERKELHSEYNKGIEMLRPVANEQKKVMKEVLDLATKVTMRDRKYAQSINLQKERPAKHVDQRKS